MDQSPTELRRKTRATTIANRATFLNKLRLNRDNFNAYANAAPNTSFEQQAIIQQKRGQQEYAVRQQTQVENNDFLLGTNSANMLRQASASPL